MDLPAEATGLLQAVVDSISEGGEVRENQREMCESVAAAIEDERHLIVEAGTGTGKSLGYLVPLIASRQTAVVATATKQLQDQLVDNDLPKVAKVLDRPLKVSVLKGRSNYLCKHKLAALKRQGQQEALIATDESGDRLQDDLAVVEEWAGETESGDKAELPSDLHPALWGKVSVSGQECPGADNCDYGEECFAEIAKAKAAESDVVVVNTALYCLDALTPANILPDHAVVVFDEAHKVEENAISATGTRVTGGRLSAAARTIRGVGIDGEIAEGLDRVSAMMQRVLERQVDEPIRLPLPERLVTVATACQERVKEASSAVASLSGGNKTDITMAKRSLHNLSEDLRRVLSPSETDAAWVEMDGKTPAWRTASANVAELLEAHLWPRVQAVLTSATIPSNLADSLGLPKGYREIDVGSPFDYEKAGLLYCATHLPEPQADEWMRKAHELIADLATAAGGRTLALFTSRYAMKRAAETVRGATDLTIYVQEGSPNPGLLRRFADEEESCLFATMGMWQGVDVPGSSLSLVVIDRLPFNRPNDPVATARRRRYGDAAFSVIDVPDAATKLAQGVGRLIRSSSDRGMVAVLDRRLVSKPYGKRLIGALPPFPLTTDFGKAESFLADILPERNGNTPTRRPVERRSVLSSHDLFDI